MCCRKKRAELQGCASLLPQSETSVNKSNKATFPDYPLRPSSPLCLSCSTSLALGPSGRRSTHCFPLPQTYDGRGGDFQKTSPCPQPCSGHFGPFIWKWNTATVGSPCRRLRRLIAAASASIVRTAARPLSWPLPSPAMPPQCV